MKEWLEPSVPGSRPATLDALRTPPPAQTLRRPRNREVRTPWSLRLDLATSTRWIWVVTGTLVVLDFLASAGAALGAPYSLTRFFDGDEKLNYPTAYKVTALLAVTLLLLALHSHARWVGDPFRKGWLLLAVVTAFAFVDESTYLHQTIGGFVHHHFNTSGVLRFAWTLVYVPALLAIGLLLLRHVEHLAPPLRTRLLAAGFVYGLGAVVTEPLKSVLSDSFTEASLSFKLVAATSDSLELVGLALLVLVLLRELTGRTDRLLVDLRGPQGTNR